MSGSGIRCAICKSAPRSRQITMPLPHHSVFYRPDALPDAQPTASKLLLLVCLKTSRDCRRPLETTGQLYIKHDAKFCAKLAAHGKENVAYIATSGVSSTRNSSRKPNYVLRVVKKANCMLTVTAGHCRLKIAYATA